MTLSLGQSFSAAQTVSVINTSRTLGWSSFLRGTEDQESVRGHDDDLRARTRSEERCGALGHGAAGRDYVVHDQACSIRHIPNDMSYLGFDAALAPLVQYDNRRAETLCVLGG